MESIHLAHEIFGSLDRGSVEYEGAGTPHFPECPFVHITCAHIMLGFCKLIGVGEQKSIQQVADSLLMTWLSSTHAIQFRLQDSSGGNFKNFIHKKLSGRIPFCTSLAINILPSKIIKLPTTTVLKLEFCLTPACVHPPLLCAQLRKTTSTKGVLELKNNPVHVTGLQ